MKIAVRQTVMAGMLSAISIVLAATPIGRIPMPTGQLATIMHIPAIVAGILEGPVVGGLVGAIFGIYSFLYPSNPAFANPLVSIVPRIFIGIVAAYIYRWTKRPWLAAALGTATNTGGVLSMFVITGFMPAQAVLVIAVTHGIPELILAVIIVTLLYRALKGRYHAISR